MAILLDTFWHHLVGERSVWTSVDPQPAVRAWDNVPERTVLSLVLLLFAVLAVACFAARADAWDVLAQAATATHGEPAEAARVLGFESLSDWSLVEGSDHASLSQSDRTTQGKASLRVSGGDRVVIRSVALSSPLVIGDIISVDVWLSADPSVADTEGTVEVVFDAPSVGVHHQSLGTSTLTGRPLEVWHTLTYAVPSVVVEKLVHLSDDGSIAGFDDFRISLAIEVPPGREYLLDNLVLNVPPESALLRAEDLPLSGPAFTDPEEAVMWIKAMVEEARLGAVALELGPEGEIGLLVNTTTAVADFVSVLMPDNTFVVMDRFSLTLGGLGGFITVAGEDICLRDTGCELEEIEAAAPVPLRSSEPACTGDRLRFCTQNTSFQTNRFFYRSVGGATWVTTGQPRACPIVDESIAGGGLFICYCPTIDYLFYCYPSFFELRDGFVVRGVPDVASLRLETTYFVEPVPGNIRSGRTDVKRNRWIGIENKLRAFLISIKIKEGGGVSPGSGVCGGLGGAMECEVKGTCSRHGATSPFSGLLLERFTSRGRTNPFDCGELIP